MAISVFLEDGLSYSDFILYYGAIHLYFCNIIGGWFVFACDSGMQDTTICSFAYDFGHELFLFEGWWLRWDGDR